MKNIVSREDRIAAIRREEGPKGAGRDEANLKYWSDRATKNSEIAPRASDGEMVLSDKGSRPVVKGRYYKSEGIEMRSEAKADKNSAGTSPYMPGVRRTQS